MPMNLEKIDAIEGDFDEVHVIVDTPKGSSNKYKFDNELAIFKLSHVLPEGMTFPFDFGFIPSTAGEDGDPLDVLLLMDQPTFCGCLVASRLIGVIEAEQTETDGKKMRNDRLLGVPLMGRRFREVRSINNLDRQMIEQISKFFVSYNEQRGKKFKVLELAGARRAEELVREGIKAYAKKQRGGKGKA
jgi:inorganic pyrophosphatase